MHWEGKLAMWLDYYLPQDAFKDSSAPDTLSVFHLAEG